MLEISVDILNLTMKCMTDSGSLSPGMYSIISKYQIYSNYMILLIRLGDCLKKTGLWNWLKNH
jgi:hypothetical protein